MLLKMLGSEGLFLNNAGIKLLTEFKTPKSYQRPLGGCLSSTSPGTGEKKEKKGEGVLYLLAEAHTLQ